MEYLMAKKMQLTRFLYGLLLILLSLAPFQGLITTWPASIFGYQLLWQVWKELLLLPAVLVIGAVVIGRPALRQKLLKDRIFIAMGAYGLLTLILAALSDNGREAALAGVLLNLRLLAIYFFAWTVGMLLKGDTKRVFQRYVLPVALIIAAFALLQITVLSPEFLKHFGYAGDPIPARFTIDNDLNAIRAASFTRGPNPLGAFLILPTIVVASYGYRLFRQRKHRYTWRHFFYVASPLVVLLGGLYATHSRSAMLGLFVAGGSWLGLRLTRRSRVYLIGLLTVLVVLFGIMTYTFRTTPFVKNTIFHDNSGNVSTATSNAGHIESLEEGVKDVKERPLLGCGPGCAGPASTRSTSSPKIAENYYIQIAQETGIVGLGLFLVIIILIGRQLYRLQETDWFAGIMLAVLIGLSVTNLLLHTWADDTVAYIWWGLAGLLIGSYNHLDSGTANARRPRTSG